MEIAIDIDENNVGNVPTETAPVQTMQELKDSKVQPMVAPDAPVQGVDEEMKVVGKIQSAAFGGFTKSYHS